MLIRVKVPLICHAQPFLEAGYHRLQVTPRCVLLLLLLGLLLLLLLRSGGRGMICLSSNMDQVLNTVCDQASTAEAQGDLCGEMCEVNTLLPTHCVAGGGDKQVVFAAVLRGQEVFVKGRTTDLQVDTKGSVFVVNEETGEEDMFPSLEEFRDMVSSHLSLNMNLSLGTTSLFKLWPARMEERERLSQAENKELLHQAMKNVWTLALDNEYVFSRIFSHYDVFPEMFGSCGGIYVVERLRPLDMPSYLQRVNFQGWVERVKVSLAILDLLEELDNMFLAPLHLCDIKPEHFGLSDHARAKFLDLDSVFLKPVVDRTVGDGSDCSQHEDCDLFDCRGHCDSTTGKCLGAVVNNNLQVVCEKLFLGSSLGFQFLGGTGLLNSKHASFRLQRALKRCANPAKSKDGVRTAAGGEIFRDLYTSLEEVVGVHEVLKQ